MKSFLSLVVLPMALFVVGNYLGFKRGYEYTPKDKQLCYYWKLDRGGINVPIDQYGKFRKTVAQMGRVHNEVKKCGI